MKKFTTAFLEPGQYPLWDRFVEKSPQGAVFCHSWWLEAVAPSRFQIAAVLEDGTIAAGIPLPFDERGRINEPPVTRTLGVLYKDMGCLSPRKKASYQRAWLTALLDLIPLDKFAQMCAHHHFTDWLPFRWKGLLQTTRYTYLIDYRDPGLDLWNQMNRAQKRNINRARAHDIRVEACDDFELLYRFQTLPFERQGLVFKIPYPVLKRLDDELRIRKMRVIFRAAGPDGRPHAMLYCVMNSKSAYALLGGADPSLRHLEGQCLARWEALQYFRDKVDVYNFGGSDIQRIEQHVRGFGGTLTPYYRIYNPALLEDEGGIKNHLVLAARHLRTALKGLYRRLLGGSRRPPA